MCGFAGFWQPFKPLGQTKAAQTAADMASRIIHRGPDDQGVFTAEDGSYAVGFRRLAIVDLSDAGHQPMISACRRYAMAFNGEIYNAEELRPALLARGHIFRGHSDTEALLEHIAAFGLAATLEQLIGMFALALWDLKHRKLVLVRDRIGIKPLYLWQQSGTLLFASTPKAFFGHPHFEPKINGNALHGYLRFGYLPGQDSIFERARKVAPGTWLEIDSPDHIKEHRFWQFPAPTSRTPQNEPRSIAELSGELQALIGDAVKRRMLADVPLGAFLSGGIDSSTVVAMMCEQSASPIQTFSIGFREAEFDEAPHARAVAHHLGTEHHELYVGAADALSLVPDLAQWFDEPFADSSALPTLLLSQTTQQHVTVALSGDGGDELFGGYKRYWEIADLFGKTQAIPKPLRHAGAMGLRGLSPLLNQAETLAPSMSARFRPGFRARKLADLLTREPRWLMRNVVGHWQSPEKLALRGQEHIDPVWLNGQYNNDPTTLVSDLQYADSVTYLTEDILTKLDRASMAVGLEARVPLLDHRIVEFCWRLPAAIRSRRTPAKFLLRQVLDRYVPAELIDRPKQGFSVPIHTWLRGPLKDWAAHLLDPKRLSNAGLIDPAIAQRYWQQHLKGQADWRYPLWNLLMFEAWRETWMTTPEPKTPKPTTRVLSEPGRLRANHPTMST